jgi:transcriptional regulator with XRE-family HTH domain
VSKKTISRIEASDDGYESRGRTLTNIAKVLGVDAKKLAAPPTACGDNDDNEMLFWGVARKFKLPENSALSLAFVEDRYGVSADEIIEAAPLFFALIAELSLERRRERTSQIEAAIKQLDELMEKSHLPNLMYQDFFDLGQIVDYDLKSIDNKDLFGSILVDEVYENVNQIDLSGRNIFLLYLKELVRNLLTGLVKVRVFDPSVMPVFSIGESEIERITGGDDRAKCALASGFARIRDIPAELQSDKKLDERVQWLRERVPDAKWEKLRNPLDCLSGLL